MDKLRKLQDEVISLARKIFGKPLSARVVDAFYAVPRHRFVKKYRAGSKDEWQTVSEQNLQSQLEAIYDDRPLVIHESAAGVSTISQPSFVVYLLELLRVEEGQRVFEVGTGSGWNAALMGYLVGPAGKVISMEIIPELARSAKESISEFPLAHVEVLEGDAGLGCDLHAPYDRAIFTAGAGDLPKFFFDQMRAGGLLLFIFKNKGSTDTLILFQKMNDHFQSVLTMRCAFVPMTGKFSAGSAEDPELIRILSAKPFSVNVRAYPIERKLEVKAGEYLVRRQESQFLFTISK